MNKWIDISRVLSCDIVPHFLSFFHHDLLTVFYSGVSFWKSGLNLFKHLLIQRSHKQKRPWLVDLYIYIYDYEIAKFHSFTRKSCRFVPHTSGGRQATKNVDRYHKRDVNIDWSEVGSGTFGARIYNPSTQEEIHSCLKQLLSLSPEQREDDSSDWEKKMQQHVTCEDFFFWKILK